MSFRWGGVAFRALHVCLMEDDLRMVQLPWRAAPPKIRIARDELQQPGTAGSFFERPGFVVLVRLRRFFQLGGVSFGACVLYGRARVSAFSYMLMLCV